ncbi:hypothetical protein [Ectobacillus ponti]|uniref:Uncharacterized protein n=1 Tax=Ectobacillus ponti TaxID=2961894 RepID=A0AA42BR36_9BACI|nr:hypothetical protein [Ectobacillus ponti]MCP8969084.1 hypothetical protein [Ectobacillus ponti]
MTAAVNLSTIRKVVHLHDEYQVNSFLHDGWVLLSVGTVVNGDTATVVHILGRDMEEGPEDEFDKFLCEYIS